MTHIRHIYIYIHTIQCRGRDLVNPGHLKPTIRDQGQFDLSEDPLFTQHIHHPPPPRACPPPCPPPPPLPGNQMLREKDESSGYTLDFYLLIIAPMTVIE